MCHVVQVHAGGAGQSHRTVQPLLPDPFAELTATAGPAAGGLTLAGSGGSVPPFSVPMQGFGLGPQAAQPQLQPVRHAISQPVVVERTLALEQSGGPGGWQEAGLQAAGAVHPGGSTPQRQQYHNPFAAAIHTSAPSIAEQDQKRPLLQPPPFAHAGIKPGGLHLGPDGVPLGGFPGIAAGGSRGSSPNASPGIYPARSAGLGVGSMPVVEGLPQHGRQASWPAAALHWQMAAEPVAHTVVIGGGGQPAMPSPFCLPPGVSRQSSLGTGSPAQVTPAPTLYSLDGSTSCCTHVTHLCTVAARCHSTQRQSECARRGW